MLNKGRANIVRCPKRTIFSNGMFEKVIDSIYKRRYNYSVDVSGTGIPPPSKLPPAERREWALLLEWLWKFESSRLHQI